MRRRKKSGLPFGTILAIIVLVGAIAYQVYDSGALGELAQQPIASPNYDKDSVADALKLFGARD